MKRFILLTLLISTVMGVSAQRKVRKDVRTGNNAYKEQLYGKAEQHYKAALNENSASKEASFNLGNTYYRQGQMDEALDEYRHYLTIEAESPENASAAWSNIGNTLLKKKAEEKMALQPGAQGANPQQPQIDYLKETMEAYKNALRINPNDNETRYNLAVVQKMIEDQENDEDNGQDEQKQDQQQDEQKDQQNNNPQNDQQQNQKQDQQQQNQNQMSKENMEQILKAIEQDEKETQERVQTRKAIEQRQKNEQNRKQDKDW